MKVYRAYFSWYDDYQHIGLFMFQGSAWVACYKYYKKHLVREFCFEHKKFYFEENACNCKKKRLTSSRYTRFSIVEEEVL